MTAPMISIEGLSKSFKTDFWKKSVHALSEVTFDVREGQVFGLVGHNGAGKTTLIKTLIGLISPTRGSVRMFDGPANSPSVKAKIGYLPEAAYYYEFLRADEILRFYAGLFGLSGAAAERRIDEMLDLVGLSDRREIRLRYFSKGMLQRIGIAQALINDPSLVIMDEPMSGLDPIGRKDVRDIILELRRRGKTIVFSSHILSDIESLCDHVAILAKGKLQAVGPLSELVQPKTRSVEIVLQGDVPREWESRFALTARRVGEQSVLELTQPERLPEILAEVVARRLPVASVVPHRETLEDLYVETAKGDA